MDSDKGLGPGYWNCLHGFDVGVPVWGEPGKEANIAGCKKCKQEIKKCTHWFCMCLIPVHKWLQVQLTLWRLICTYSVQWRLHIWNLQPDWKGEHTNSAFLLPWQKFAPFLHVVECSCIHAQATCSLFCSGSDIKWCVSCEMQVYSFYQDHTDSYMNLLNRMR